MSASLIGQKLGKYEIIELLGHGGMATVYKGYQSGVDRVVAVKVLPPHPGQSEEFVERFRLEARTIAHLQHPHILPLYDYGDENDILYLVMAYLEGGSLSDRIRRGALPPAEVQRLFDQIADALDYAHRQNVIHRDIKPDNILLDREGHALLADFGIVKLIEDTGTPKLTGTGGLVGTPAYMSPEQAQGLPVDHRSDIYSLGIVIYEMLTGKQPFSAETPMQIVLKHITAPVPSLGEYNTKLPPQLDAVMARALAKEPYQRYSSARQFYEDFSRVLRGEQPMTPSRVDLSTSDTVTASATPTPGGSTYIPASTAQLQPTIVAQPTWNPLILLGGFAIIALLLVAVVALLLNVNHTPITPTALAPTVETALPVAALPSPVSTVPNFGTVSYTTNQTLGDTVDITVKGLTAPPSGSNYRVWLYNTNTKWSLNVGDLRLDPLGSGQLSFTGSNQLLPMLYNAVLITQETGSAGAAPAGKVAYSGSVPAQVMGGLRAILITSPDGIPDTPSATPADGGLAQSTAEAGTQEADATEEVSTSSLLAGVLEEAAIGEKHAGLAAQANSPGSLHTHAEHTINILNGTYVDYNGNGRGENPGLGYGIAYFTDRIQDKLQAIADARSNDHLVQSQVELIRICIVNVRNWMSQVVNLESQMLTVEDLAAVHPQLVDATNDAHAIINGVDLNGNGQIEPFEGECGLQQIDDYGISVANITINSGALPQGD